VTFAVAFTDYTPAPRFDNSPWTQVRIDEAELADGPWTTIDTLDLDPLDDDPENPISRSFSTVNATLPVGWYRVVFLDGNNDEAVSAPVMHPPADAAIRPTVSEVAALEHTRLTTSGSGKATTFNSQTTPTADQAERLISQATELVLGDLPTRIPTQFQGRVRGLIALQAAILVETSFYREQLDSGSVAVYERLLTTGSTSVTSAIEEFSDGVTAAPGMGMGQVDVVVDNGQVGYPGYPWGIGTPGSIPRKRFLS